MEDRHLNAIQRRCLAVLRGGRAGDELKAAATTMLRSGEPSKRARTSGGQSNATLAPVQEAAIAAAADVKPAKKPRSAEWVCAACTLKNLAAASTCAACGAAKSVKATTNGSKQPRVQRLPDDLDEADADAFAVPKSKTRAPAIAAPAASHAEPDHARGEEQADGPPPAGLADAEDSDEWE